MVLTEVLLLALTLAVIALAAAVGWLWQRSEEQATSTAVRPERSAAESKGALTPTAVRSPPQAPTAVRPPPRALRINAYGELEE